MADTSTLVLALQALTLVDMATEFPKWLKVQAQLSQYLFSPTVNVHTQTCVLMARKQMSKHL